MQKITRRHNVCGAPCLLALHKPPPLQIGSHRQLFFSVVQQKSTLQLETNPLPLRAYLKISLKGHAMWSMLPYLIEVYAYTAYEGRCLFL